MAEALGIKIQGVIIGSVTSDSLAEKANLKEGDIIIGYDGKVLNEENRLPRLVGETDVGKTVTLNVWRKGKKIILYVTVAEYEEAVKTGKMDDLDATKRLNIAEAFGLTFGPITEWARNRLHLSSQVKGVLIIKSEPESAGDDADLVVGEVITEVNQKEIQTPHDFMEKINQAKKDGHKNVMLSIIGKHGLYHLSLGIDE
jgi:serine protease Do